MKVGAWLLPIFFIGGILAAHFALKDWACDGACNSLGAAAGQNEGGHCVCYWD